MNDNLTIDVPMGDDVQITTEECCPVSIDNDVTLPTLVSIDSDVAVTTSVAPTYSLMTNIPVDQNVFLSGDNITTPEAPLYSPITPIDRNSFLSGGNITIPESRENS